MEYYSRHSSLLLLIWRHTFCGENLSKIIHVSVRATTKKQIFQYLVLFFSFTTNWLIENHGQNLFSILWIFLFSGYIDPLGTLDFNQRTLTVISKYIQDIKLTVSLTEEFLLNIIPSESFYTWEIFMFYFYLKH